MVKINQKSIAILSLTFLLLGNFQATALASEITGTLSSDGETKTQQEVALSETDNGEVSGLMTTQSSNQISGSVTGGREDGAAVMLVDSPLLDTALWVLPIAAAILAAFAYISYRRQPL